MKESNPVQEYLDELNKIEIPDNEESILEFLESLDSKHQKWYLSFILSQSHIFDSMEEVIDTYTNNTFYTNAGYNDREGNIVPKINDEGRVYYEKYTSSETTDKICRTILASLQSDDKSTWKKFVQYVKRIYEPSKMDIYNNPQMNQFSQDVLLDFDLLNGEIVQNDRLRDEISEINNKPVVRPKGFIKKIKEYFSKRKKARELKQKQSSLQDDNKFTEKAIALIEKYKGNKNTSMLMKDQLEFAERLIKAGTDKESFSKILQGLGRVAESSSYSNYRIFDMLKHLSSNATIGRELYLPEIIYATSFQEMTKNIRLLLIKHDLNEQAEIKTDYRKNPLKNQMLAGEDISNILKGKNLSQEEIENKMSELDEEFRNNLTEENPEKYVRKCTDLMLKFISIHPFDDGNGRTARMLMQVMLARRGILFPSTIDNYFERQQGTEYSIIEENSLRTDDYTAMEDYMVKRAKMFNNGVIEFSSEPLVFEKQDKEKEQDISCQK